MISKAKIRNRIMMQMPYGIGDIDGFQNQMLQNMMCVSIRNYTEKRRFRRILEVTREGYYSLHWLLCDLQRYPNERRGQW